MFPKTILLLAASLSLFSQVSAIPSGAGGAPGSSSLIFLERKTASNSASLTFTSSIIASYDQYVIEILSLVPANDSVTFNFQISTDGGSNYISAANYQWAAYRATQSSSGYQGNYSQTAIDITAGIQMDNNSNWGINGTMKLYLPSGKYMRVEGQMSSFENSSTLLLWYSFAGSYNIVNSPNAFRIIASAGNIASGTVRVYGVYKP